MLFQDFVHRCVSSRCLELHCAVRAFFTRVEISKILSYFVEEMIFPFAKLPFKVLCCSFFRKFWITLERRGEKRQ